MIVIAFSGKKKHGKNTAANILAAKTNLVCAEFAFADDLKIELAKMLGISVKEIEQNKDLYRHLLQALGVYRRETKGQDYWVEKVLFKMSRSTADLALVTDTRFLNEYTKMAYIGAVIIRVNRPSIVSTDAHPSETELDNVPFDFVLTNDSLDNLASQIEMLMQKLNIKTK